MAVYMIRAGDTDRVKIGLAVNVAARVASLQTASWEKLHVLRTWPGGRKTEAWIHERFSHQRVSGEWFRFCLDMLSVDPPVTEDEDGPVARIIDHLGGAIRVARAIKISPTTVSNWKGRNSIPAWHHKTVIDAFPGLVTASQLIEAHASSETA